jgi:hypothetical protein
MHTEVGLVGLRSIRRSVPVGSDSNRADQG